MKAWLGEPITRAEAIAWALLVPAVLVAVSSGWAVVGSLSAVRKLMRNFETPVPSEVEFYLGVGELKVALLFGICALVPIVAVATRQRPWVKLAAPVVFGVIAYSMLHYYSTSSSEWLRAAARAELDTLAGERR